MALIIASLNGERPFSEHPRIPKDGPALAVDAKLAVRAGANVIHAHSRSAEGAQVLNAAAVRETVLLLNAAVPGIPISLSTSARAEPDPDRLVSLISSWDVLPDLATVDLWQEGWLGLIEVLLGAGVGVEIGLSTGEEAERFMHTEYSSQIVRVMLEPMEEDPLAALASAAAARKVVADGGYRGPFLLHGWNTTAWPVLRYAIEAQCDIRIGLEDTLILPDGRVASGNDELVAMARELLQGGLGRVK
jgi:uncharacterized protein (DUF849 family)